MDTTTIVILGGALLLESFVLVAMYKHMSDSVENKKLIDEYAQKVLQQARGYAQLVADVLGAIPKNNIKTVNKGLKEKGFEIVNEIPKDEKGNAISEDKVNVIKSLPKKEEPNKKEETSKKKSK